MWHHKIYKQFTVGLSCSLMMIIATTAIADNYISQYSLRLEDEQSNPWALPITPQRFQEIPRSWGQKYNRGFRFVTQKTLESLKQQQTQTQLMPENKEHPLYSTTVTHH